jgi:hypothetical protein
MIFRIIRFFGIQESAVLPSRYARKHLKTNKDVNGPLIATYQVPVMYRLPQDGNPRTAGSGKSNRKVSGP